MKFKKLFLVIILLSNSVFLIAQENIISGFYKRKGTDVEVQGEFKKEEFLTSKKFLFKQVGSNDFETLDTKNISEIQIGNEYKFVNKYIEYDVSNRESISFIKEPLLKREWILLNVVLESTEGATLYSYYENEATRYFVTVAGSNNNELYLVNKKYFSEVNKISVNKAFRNQLYTELKGQPSNLIDFENLKYSTESIKNVVTKYNTANNFTQKEYNNSLANKSKFKFTIFGGANLTNFSVEQSGEFNTDAEKKIQPSVGVEAALQLPSENFDIFLRLEYERFSGTTSRSRKNSDASPFATGHIFTFESSIFNISVGPRWNFYKNNKSKLFAEIGGGLSFPSDAIMYEKKSGTASIFTQIETNPAMLLNFSLGYQFDKKWSIDFRYDFPRNYFTNTYTTSTTKYSRLGLNLKYTLN